MKNQSFIWRLTHAAGGIRSAFRTETSFRTQLLLAAVLAGVLALLRPPLVWAALAPRDPGSQGLRGRRGPLCANCRRGQRSQNDQNAENSRKVIVDHFTPAIVRVASVP